jgi:hypothetical protein
MSGKTIDYQWTEEGQVEVPMWVITSSDHKECLQRVKTILGYDALIVQSSGMHYRLMMPFVDWEKLDQIAHDYILDYAAGFSQGWDERGTYSENDSWESDER